MFGCCDSQLAMYASRRNIAVWVCRLLCLPALPCIAAGAAWPLVFVWPDRSRFCRLIARSGVHVVPYVPARRSEAAWQ